MSSYFKQHLAHLRKYSIPREGWDKLLSHNSQCWDELCLIRVSLLVPLMESLGAPFWNQSHNLCIFLDKKKLQISWNKDQLAGTLWFQQNFALCVRVQRVCFNWKVNFSSSIYIELVSRQPEFWALSWYVFVIFVITGNGNIFLTLTIIWTNSEAYDRNFIIIIIIIHPTQM